MGIINDGFKIFDPRLMTSLSQTNFKDTIKNALFKSLRGKARLKGTGEMVHFYPYLESEANKTGTAGVIKWGGELMSVPVSAIEVVNGKYKPKYFFAKSKYYKKYLTLTIQLPISMKDKDGNVIKEESQDRTFYADRNNPLCKSDEDLFAILENDVDMTPDLLGIDDDLERLEVIMDAIFHDIVISKKKIYFVFPQDPDGDDWKKVNDLWNKDIMGYIALPKSAQDVGGGKEGIDPDKIQLQVYQPDNKGRDLWADYRNFMREMLWKYGIPFDILEDKKERASVKEVEEAHTYFSNITNERRQCRLNFINWVIRNWGGDYELIYN